MNHLLSHQTAPAPAHRELVLVTMAIFLQVFLSALDTTIIGTAMPTVVAALGGLNLYGWVFSAYMLTSTVATPIAGKLSDQLSRKRLYLTSIAGFVISSWLCGLSQNMIMLIVCRALQGMAGGTMFAVSIGLIAVLYPPEKRGRMQGMLASVWAITSMFGPLLGGFVVEHVSWRWAFYLNLPLGLVAWLFVKRYLHESTGRVGPAPRQVRIDYLGAATLIAGVVTFLLSITNDSHTPWPWRMTLFVISLVFLFFFFQIERRAAEPILPLALLRRREIAAANLCTFITAIGMFGMIIFAPLFAQGVLLGTPSQAGMILIPISMGWALGSLTSGHTVNRFGYRLLTVTGVSLVTMGLFLQTRLDAGSSLLQLAGVCWGVGLGMGLVTTAITVSVQNTVEISQVGVATSSTVFSRTLGASVGVSVMSAILSHRLGNLLNGSAALAGVFPGMANGVLGEVRLLLQPTARAKMPPESLEILQHALEISLRDIFLFAAGLMLLAVFMAFQVSAQRPITTNAKKQLVEEPR